MSKKQATPEEEQSFEQALDRLEQIVERMEAEQLPLEQLLAQYEEGVKLVNFCSERLAAAEKRIEIISRNASGKLEVADFESAPKPAPEDPGVSLF